MVCIANSKPRQPSVAFGEAVGFYLRMFSGQSIFGIAATGLYGLVLIACCGAAAAAVNHRRRGSHLAVWAIIALLFAGLVVMRALNLEEVIRQDLRFGLRAEGSYEARREFQRPLVAGVLLLASPVMCYLVYKIAAHRASRRQVAVSIAALAATGMVGLVVIRIISLHQVDALLYGPLKLNWFGDIGGSITVLAAALAYVWLVRQAR